MVLSRLASTAIWGERNNFYLVELTQAFLFLTRKLSWKRFDAAAMPTILIPKPISVEPEHPVCCCWNPIFRRRQSPESGLEPPPLSRRTFSGWLSSREPGTSSLFRNAGLDESGSGCPSRWWLDGQTSSGSRPDPHKAVLVRPRKTKNGIWAVHSALGQYFKLNQNDAFLHFVDDGNDVDDVDDVQDQTEDNAASRRSIERDL